MSNKKPTGKGGQRKGVPKNKLSERWAKVTPVKKQLQGRPCDHPRGKRTVQTNRKGRGYYECEGCGAFLGWV